MKSIPDTEMDSILSGLKRANSKDEWRTVYSKYLRTEHWLEMRETIRERCSGTCETCGSRKMKQVHHLSYTRLGNERLTDLQGLCGGCHTEAHKAKKYNNKNTKKKKLRGSKMLRDAIGRIDELEDTVNMLMDKISHLI